MKCVVPISGGIDSTVLLHYAKYHYLPERINDVYAISFRYGQKHADYELHCAMQLGRQEAVIHKRVDLKFFKDISSISALTNDNIDIAKTRDVLGDAQTVNYVPFRNQMMQKAFRSRGSFSQRHLLNSFIKFPSFQAVITAPKL